MLRTMANVVNLLVCRPHDENFRKLSPPTAEPPLPPMRSSFNFKHQQYMNQLEPILPPGVSSHFFFTFILCYVFTGNMREERKYCVCELSPCSSFVCCHKFESFLSTASILLYRGRRSFLRHMK